MAQLHFHCITLFPDAMHAYLSESLLGRAQEDGTITVSYYNPRDYTDDPHRRVDQRPYGGGPGMVLAAEPILRAARDAIGRKRNVKTVFLSAGGAQFSDARAREYAQEYRHIVIIAGHYEGVDVRVRDALDAEEVSVGPYTLTGGELPAMIVVDATARYVSGVLGNPASLEHSRTATSEVYTRPDTIRYKGNTYEVPEVLRSGDHAHIEAWRAEQERRKNDAEA